MTGSGDKTDPLRDGRGNRDRSITKSDEADGSEVFRDETGSAGREASANVDPAGPFLQARNMTGGYGAVDILNDCTIDAEKGEISVIVGPNGAGKSTAMKAIFGMLNLRKGSVTIGGEDITALSPQARVAKGMAFVPQTSNVFPSMTVEENLEMGAFLREDDFRKTIEQVYTLFPILKTRAEQRGGTLSGGEQQMLAIARALMTRPRLLLLDEPSLGLAPLIVKQIFEVIEELNRKEKLTVFLVEQNAYHALRLAHRGFVMVNGKITLSGTGKELLEREEVRAAYLEGGRH